MADKLWEAIAPLEAEADQILEAARQEAQAIVRDARLEAEALAERSASARQKQAAQTDERIDLELRLASEQAASDAEQVAAGIVAEARPRMDLAVDRVVERILSTRGNR